MTYSLACAAKLADTFCSPGAPGVTLNNTKEDNNSNLLPQTGGHPLG